MLQSSRRYENCPKSTLDVAESLWERIITLPCSTNITDDDLQMVVSTLADVV